MADNHKIAIVTGAFGFAGASLTENLIKNGYKVYAVCREGSEHNNRLREPGEVLSSPVRTSSGERSESGSSLLSKIFLDMQDYDKIHEYVDAEELRSAERVLFFHLSWGGARDDFNAQYANVEGSLKAMDSAIAMQEIIAANAAGTKLRFIGIGSQAEYGICEDEITEETPLKPFTAYGSCKAAAYHLLKSKARIGGIDFVWGRIFSLIGKYEPVGRMFPDLCIKLKNGEDVYLSSCEQYWDYMDVADAAEAIRLLGEKGKDSESYNIANGDYHKLSYFVEKAAEVLGADKNLIHYGQKAEPFVSLKPSVSKLKADTGFEISIIFEKTLRNTFIDI